ncbi:MAG: signal peptidase I [Chloroflexi bacterium]|nr:MAG: signal peptidase I [Chloroflexota bacterium]
MSGRAREIFWMVLVMVVVFVGVQMSVQSFRVDGESMEPSFEDGQYLIVDKLTYRFHSPSRGDVVVFHNPQYYDELYIKRVIGLPGERVDIRQGRVYINGAELQEVPQWASIPNSEGYSTTVPEGEYFVLGDNRSNSSGSHTFDTVPEDYIVGRVWISYWPPSDWGLSPSYSAEMAQVTSA